VFACWVIARILRPPSPARDGEQQSELTRVRVKSDA